MPTNIINLAEHRMPTPQEVNNASAVIAAWAAEADHIDGGLGSATDEVRLDQLELAQEILERAQRLRSAAVKIATLRQ